MTSYTYKKILEKAKTCKTSTEKKYKLGIGTGWTYYICQAIIKQDKKDVTRLSKTVGKAPKPSGTYISRQMSKSDYLKQAKSLVKFVKNHGRLPNYLSWGAYKIRPSVYTYMFSRILVYYENKNKLPSKVKINSKCFTKPVETKNEVYNYFCKVFNDGKKITTIDSALKLVESRGYSYYYDDRYSNKESIDRIKKKLGVNCTDSTALFYNIVEELIELGKYKKVECVHVQCSAGGHVKLRITKNDGSKFIRDPACVLSDNGKGVKCTWCGNSGVSNPSWFLENLRR